MNDEAKFWLDVWTRIVFASLVVAMFLLASCQLTKGRIAEAISAGVPPLEAVCALSFEPDHDCNLLYAKEAHDE